ARQVQAIQLGAFPGTLPGIERSARHALPTDEQAEKLPDRCGTLRPSMYVETILPLAVPGTFTYAVPDNCGPVNPGMRVAVLMGRGRRMYTAVVRRVTDHAPEGRTVRPLISVIDKEPVVTGTQLALWDT